MDRARHTLTLLSLRADSVEGRCLASMAVWQLSCAVVLSVALDASVAAAQSERPEGSDLPHLTFTALPSSGRAPLEEAYKAARADPRDPSAVGRLGMILHAYEQYRSAQLCYRRAREIASRSVTWTYLSAVVASELDENSEAAALFRRVLELDPDYWPARLRLADVLMRAGDLDRSQTEYEGLVRDFPELAVAHYGLGRLLWNRRLAAAAIEHYQRAVDLEPQFGPAHYALALAYRDEGAADRAKAHLDAYRQFGMRRPVPADRLLDQISSLKGTARDLLAEGARLGRAGLLSEAIAAHLKALAADPSDAQAHVNLISLYGRTGETSKAEEHYRAALTVGGSLAEAHYNYGVLLVSVGRRDAAVDAFRQALGIDPFHAQAHNNLAALLAATGRLSEAAVHYRQALANDPQHRGARANLGRVLMALGQPREAIEQLQKALLPEDADTPGYLYALSTAYLAVGNADEAKKYAAQALSRATEHGQIALAASIEQFLRQMKSAGR
jgi:tetratricopeptide (TPR) repeat protein